jgi:hypothetical protein
MALHMAAPFYILTSSGQGFESLHIFASTCSSVRSLYSFHPVLSTVSFVLE